MSIRASNKRWIAALSAALMVCVCASACAQDYSLGDEADEIATIQTALKQLKLYSAGITGHYGGFSDAAVMAADRAGIQAERGQVLLELHDLVAARAITEDGAVRHGGRGGRRRRRG